MAGPFPWAWMKYKWIVGVQVQCHVKGHCRIIAKKNNYLSISRGDNRTGTGGWAASSGARRPQPGEREHTDRPMSCILSADCCEGLHPLLLFLMEPDRSLQVQHLTSHH